MKPRIASLAAVCLVIIGLFLSAGPSGPTEVPAARAADLTASRGTEHSLFDPQSSVVGSSPVLAPTTTVPPTTTTVVPATTIKPTTTVKPKPRVTTTTAPRPKTTAPANGDWTGLIGQYPWDTAHAYRIMMCESGGNPNAINKSSGATGLFQIHPGGSKYLDPATNVATAYAKYKAAGGWSPWVCTG